MQTRIYTTETPEAQRDAVEAAVRHLGEGQPVGLPTETVYGLAADATDEDAVARIFEAKERPSFDPLIVHLPDKKYVEQVAEIPEETAKVVKSLMNLFWPGPLTFLLPKKETIPDIVTSGLPEVAVRLSKDPVFSEIVSEFGKPLAAPSANRFGRISPTSATAVNEELHGRIPAIVDGGACHAGLESTIIRVSEGKPKPIITILRPGPVTAEDLKKYGKIETAPPVGADPEKPEVPGQLPSHYAPTTPLRLLESPDEFVPEPDKSYALLSYRGKEKDGYLDLADFVETAVLSPGSGKLPEAAVRFFFLLRQLDRCGADEIIAEPVPDRGLGAAIMNRLRRASA